tara:strand:+ start:420 stop:590 length:171 start_codon:yes stop_codon:yes gene_type:complete
MSAKKKPIEQHVVQKQICLTAELKEKSTTYAKKNHLSFSGLVVQLLVSKLKKEKAL